MFEILQKLYPNFADLGLTGFVILINFGLVIKFIKTLEKQQKRCAKERIERDENFIKALESNRKEFAAIIENNTKAINNLKQAFEQKNVSTISTRRSLWN
jgi:D-serine dehydratase